MSQRTFTADTQKRVGYGQWSENAKIRRRSNKLLLLLSLDGPKKKKKRNNNIKTDNLFWRKCRLNDITQKRNASSINIFISFRAENFFLRSFLRLVRFDFSPHFFFAALARISAFGWVAIFMFYFFVRSFSAKSETCISLILLARPMLLDIDFFFFGRTSSPNN